MSRIDDSPLVTPPESHPEAFPERRDRVASRLLGLPISLALVGLVLFQLASWLPHYLTWPFWADHDVYATLALGWDRGLLPYRDLACNNFPGTIYVYWALGRLAGWGGTLPFNAFDATLVVLFGAAVVAWSRRRFGRGLPGLVGYLAFLTYYFGLDYARSGQHDWHAAFFAILGIFAVQGWSGRAARVLSALALAAAIVTRPQAALYLPAVALALDEHARRPGEPLRRTLRAWVEWGVAFAAFVALGFAPLVAAGILPDFVRGVRLVAYGGRYNKVSAWSIAYTWTAQLSPLRLVVVPLALFLFRDWGDRAARRTALTWGVALAVISLYKPLSPVPHAYLDIPLMVVWSVALAVMVHMTLASRALRPSLRFTLVVVFLALGVTARPIFCSLTSSARALATLGRGTMPSGMPLGYRAGVVPTAAYYTWDDYYRTLEYVKRETGPETLVANVLKGDSALTGPAARLPAFPAESITWLKIVNPSDEERFARALDQAGNSVVVWVPTEAKPPFEKLTAVIERKYEPAAKFGEIEVWRRRAEARGVARR